MALNKRRFDALIIGAGGAGLNAAIQLANTDARVAPYGLVNIRGGIESGEGGWRITGWAKNLANKRVKQRLFDLFDQDVIGQSFIALNEPRTYGVSLDVSF